VTIILQRIRLFVRTADGRSSGTDSPVDLRFEASGSYPGDGWQSVSLDHPWNDRERSRTESYEVDFTIGDETVDDAPRGLSYRDWSEARNAQFKLEIRGSDWWNVDFVFLLGDYISREPVPNSIDAFENTALGWLLMARLDRNLSLSKDPSEGTAVHTIQLDGPLPTS